MCFKYSIYWIMALILMGCGGDKDEEIESAQRSLAYESEINKNNPAYFSQVAIYNLESPGAKAVDLVEEDSGGIGWDDIYLAGEKSKSRIFCLDIEGGSNHHAQISSDLNEDHVSLDAETPCTTMPMESGRVKVSLMHGGVTDEETVFVYEANVATRAIFSGGHNSVAINPTAVSLMHDDDGEMNASGKATVSADVSAVPMTLISTKGCPSCNLENADLSNRDLRLMDFSGANLRSANVSNSDLTSADLFKADLTNLSSDGSNFAVAIWENGTFCSPISKNNCESFILYVDAKLPWQDVGISVPTRRKIAIYPRGSWVYNANRPPVGPFGISERAIVGYPLLGGPVGALIGRLSDLEPFLFDVNETIQINSGERLSFVINDDLEQRYGLGLTDNSGSLQVVLHVIE